MLMSPCPRGAYAARLRLPAISVSRKGRVAVRSADGGEQPETGAAGGDSGAAGDAGDGAGGKKGPAVIPAKRMALGATPVALTCGIYQARAAPRPDLSRRPASLSAGRAPLAHLTPRRAAQGKLLADPTAEEEEMLESLITVALDEAGQLARPRRAPACASPLPRARVRRGGASAAARTFVSSARADAASGAQGWGQGRGDGGCLGRLHRGRARAVRRGGEEVPGAACGGGGAGCSGRATRRLGCRGKFEVTQPVGCQWGITMASEDDEKSFGRLWAAGGTK